MTVVFVSFNAEDAKVAENNQKAKGADVAAVIAQAEPKKDQNSSKSDVAAVLAMSSQPPAGESNRDLCLA